MTSEIAEYKFLAKESAYHQGDTWCIECSPKTRQFSFIGDTSSLYIQLKNGVSLEKASEIAALLNESVEVFNIVD